MATSAKVIGHRTNEIKIAPDALIYFNTHAGVLDQNPLGRIKAIKGKQYSANSLAAMLLPRRASNLSTA